MPKAIDDSAALDAIADFMVADPKLTFRDAAKKVIAEKPHLIAPSLSERKRPN